MAVASLVLGIVALVLGLFIPGAGLVSVIIGVVGIILGALGRKDEAKRGMSTAGLVMSIIAVALALLVWLACAACLASIGAAF